MEPQSTPMSLYVILLLAPAQACVLCNSCFLACFSCVPHSTADWFITTQCNCDLGYYSTGSACSDVCDPTCATCSGANAASCVTCKANGFLVNGAAPSPCECDPGFYFSTSTALCELCYLECLTCVLGTATDCITCYAHASLAATGQCVCQPGWWPSGSAKNCALCQSTCKECATGAISGCTACWGNAGLSAGTPSACVCATGYYPNLDSAACAPCHVTCFNCVGPSQSHCSSCKSTALLESASPSRCLCPSNYFPNPDAQLCQLCSTSCLTCVGANGTQCVLCKPHSDLVNNISPGTCLCNLGYYGSSANCLPCHSYCLGCSGPLASDCLSCKSNAELDITPGPALCSCNSMFYPDSAPDNCNACHSTCLDCVGGADKLCVSCWSHAGLRGGVSPEMCLCDNGFFPNSDAASCTQCHFTCQLCVGGTSLDCTRCWTNASLTESPVGKCMCDLSFYPQPTSQFCTDCHSTCRSCLDGAASSCTSCRDFAKLATEAPSPCECVSESFPLPDASHCVLCSPQCRTCVGAGTEMCAGCKENAFLARSPPSECECNPGFVPSPDASLCLPCSPVCRNCVTVEECSECKPGAVLRDGTCVCEVTYYADPDASNCVHCSEGCGDCLATGCLQCAAGFLRLDATCVSDCPVGYLQQGDNACQEVDQAPPIPSLSVTTNNTLLLSFDKPMCCSLSSADISIDLETVQKIPIPAFWPDPVLIDPQHYSIPLTFEGTYVPNNTVANLTFLRPEAVTDVFNVTVTTLSLLSPIYPVGSPTPASNASETLLTTTVAAQTTAIGKGTVSAGVVSSLVTSNPSSLMAMVNQLQLISYVSMTRIPIPEEFGSVLAAMNVAQMIPNPLSQYFSLPSPSQPPPPHVQTYGISTCLFLSNSLSILLPASLILLSFLPLALLSLLPLPALQAYCRRFLPALRWSVPLNLWITAYLDLGIFALLQLESITISFETGLGGVSLVAAVMVLVAWAATPALVVYFLYIRFSLVCGREDEGFNKRWGALFEAFKCDRKVAYVSYFPLFFLRRLTLALTLILSDHILWLLASLNTVFCLTVTPRQSLLFMLAYRPHKELMDQIEAIQAEVSTFAIYLIASGFLLDLTEVHREALNMIGCWCARIAILLSASISLLRLGLSLFRVFHYYRKARKVAEGKYRMKRRAEELAEIEEGVGDIRG